jgi:hypothetical protein
LRKGIRKFECRRAKQALWRTNIAANVPSLRPKFLVYKGFVV